MSMTVTRGFWKESKGERSRVYHEGFKEDYREISSRTVYGTQYYKIFL